MSNVIKLSIICFLWIASLKCLGQPENFFDKYLDDNPYLLLFQNIIPSPLEITIIEGSIPKAMDCVPKYHDSINWVKKGNDLFFYIASSKEDFTINRELNSLLDDFQSDEERFQFLYGVYITYLKTSICWASSSDNLWEIYPTNGKHDFSEIKRFYNQIEDKSDLADLMESIEKMEAIFLLYAPKAMPLTDNLIHGFFDENTCFCTFKDEDLKLFYLDLNKILDQEFE